jgi:predicted Zn-dependent protease
MAMNRYVVAALGGNLKLFDAFLLVAVDAHVPFAKILLALTALREKKPEVAREELTELVAEFPGNLLFASELAKVNVTPAAAVSESWKALCSVLPDAN